MTRRPLLAVGLVGTLLGGILSGCSDGGTATNSAAVSSTDSTATPAQKQAVAKAANPTPAVAASGDDFASAWGPAVGSNIPMLAANDHTGTAQSLGSLSGDKGLLLVFSRSADW